MARKREIILDLIEETEVRSIEEDRKILKTHLNNYKKLKASLEARESKIISRIEKGAKVVSTNYSVKIIKRAGACRPKWHDEFIALCVQMGLSAAERVLAVKKRVGNPILKKLEICEIDSSVTVTSRRKIRRS